VDFVVHVFSEKARKFYDLERLWKTARRLEPSELKAQTRAKTGAKTGAKTVPKTRTTSRKPSAPTALRKKA